MPKPDCFAATISDAATEFVLLLEDMGDAVQGDQITGCTPAQAEAVAVAAAGLHAPGWNDAGLLTDMPLPGEPEREMMESILAPMADAYRDRFSPDSRDLQRSTGSSAMPVTGSSRPWTTPRSSTATSASTTCCSVPAAR